MNRICHSCFIHISILVCYSSHYYLHVLENCLSLIHLILIVQSVHMAKYISSLLKKYAVTDILFVLLGILVTMFNDFPFY